MPDQTHWLWLRAAALLYTVGLVLHTADHVRRGIDVIKPAVLWAGNVSTLLGITVVALVLMQHRAAPLMAALAGIPTALGVAAVHLLPSWGALSDSFIDSAPGVTAFSWLVVLLEIVGALAMGFVGFTMVRAAPTHSSRTSSGTPSRSVASTGAP
jgi:hypothetical protein